MKSINHKGHKGKTHKGTQRKKKKNLHREPQRSTEDHREEGVRV